MKSSPTNLFSVRHNKKTRKWEIVRTEDRKVVGRSVTKDLAMRSIAHRMSGIE